MLDLEDVISRRDSVVKSPEWAELVELFNKSEDIYLAGNGGNFAVATHAACDVGRLTDKNIITLRDTPGHTKLAGKMISELYQADVGVFVVSAKGAESDQDKCMVLVKEQCLYAYGAGLKQVIVCIN